MIAAVLVLALLAAPATAEPLPTAEAILARVRAASPAPPAFTRTTETVYSDGMTTSVRRMQRGDDYRNVRGAGPFHEEDGSFKGEQWHQNANGQTVLDESDPGVAKSDPTTTTVSRVHDPIDAYVIAELNLAGHGSREYVDPLTWQIVRRERITGNGVITTTYDDFRADGGRTFAHHWKTDDRYARTTSESRVTAYQPGGVTDADVERPDSRRRLVEFPPGVRSSTLPSKFGAQHVFVRVVINGRGLDFTLDTGAGVITIDNGVARELGLTVYGKQSAVSAGRVTTGRTVVPEMRVGNLVMHDVVVQIVPDGWQEDTGIKSVGILGFDFLAELGVTVDYEHERIVAVPEPEFKPPEGKPVIPIDVRIGSGTPHFDVAINGAVGERFTLDTGGAGSIMIFDAFARKHPEALKDKGGGGDARTMSFYGIGGDIPTRPYQLNSVRLGPLNLVDFVAYRVTSAASYEGVDDGLIGAEFLRMFTLGLDYGNSRIYLVPNAYGRRAMGIR